MSRRLAAALTACVLAVGLLWVLPGGEDPAARTAAPGGPAIVLAREDAGGLVGAQASGPAHDKGTNPAPTPLAPRDGSDRAPVGELRTATLSVLVREEGNGRPLRDVHLTLVRKDERADAAGGEPAGPRRIAGMLTDAEGRAELEVPLGSSWVLRARPPSQAHDGLSRDLPALTSTDPAEVVLELASRYDLAFLGRVVAAESGAPLADARARVSTSTYRSSGGSGPRPEIVAQTETDGSGVFELRLPSGDDLHARISAPGRSERLVQITRGHETRAQALEIRLPLAASVDALVLGRDGSPVAGAGVRLSTPSYEVDQAEDLASSLILGDLTWSGETDEQGRCAIEGLPPRSHLALELRLADGRVRREATALQLEAGERRRVVLRLGAGAVVSGVLVGLDDLPVVDAQVWMLAEPSGRPQQLRSHRQGEARVATSDRAGRFVFDDVPDGLWLVGPSPQGPYASEGQTVAVLEGLADRELVLAAHAGLFLRGTVVDPEGTPVQGVFVLGFRDGSVPVQPGKPSDAQGRFELGPLVEGSYRLSVILTPLAPPGLSPAGSIEAQAGADDVRVELLPGGSLRGVLVDGATGAPLEGQVVLSAATPLPPFGGRIHGLGTSDRDGRFRFDGVAPGAYDLAASASGLAVVVRGVEVRAGLPGPELTLRAQPGARVAVRYEGDEPYAGFTIYAAGAAVHSDGLRSGSEDVHVVPAGPIRVELTWKGLATPRVRELTLQVGERGEVAFVDDP